MKLIGTLEEHLSRNPDGFFRNDKFCYDKNTFVHNVKKRNTPIKTECDEYGPIIYVGSGRIMTKYPEQFTEYPYSCGVSNVKLAGGYSTALSQTQVDDPNWYEYIADNQ